VAAYRYRRKEEGQEQELPQRLELPQAGQAVLHREGIGTFKAVQAVIQSFRQSATVQTQVRAAAPLHGMEPAIPVVPQR
jgi:hypothetical protein